MAIYFANAGEIDLSVIRVMGVSVKQTDTPIGYFGTGLKFALATLLRTGHHVALFTGGETYTFTARDVQVRDRSFRQVYMNDEPLPFTTELGKNWEVWQAYRELHSNTLDESGTITDKPTTADTVFVVQGPEAERVYEARHEIFLSSKPLEILDGVEVHPKPSSYIYYRGVRVAQLPETCCFTYNVTTSMELTEDRTLKSMWSLEYLLETKLPTTKSERVAHALISGHERWDQCLNFTYCGAPSDVFMDVARRFRNDASVSQNVRRMVEQGDQRDGIWPEHTPTADESAVLREAFAILEYMECDLDLYEVQVTETLGPSVMGLYHRERDQIFVCREALRQGDRFAAMVLYEEWLHKRHKLEDNTRAMQTFLLNKLISAVVGTPADA
jgi:hypothetical protein